MAKKKVEKKVNWRELTKDLPIPAHYDDPLLAWEIHVAYMRATGRL